MTNQEYVKSRLIKAKEFKTNMVIGKAVNVFKSIYEGDYYTINTEREVKSFIDYWSVPNNEDLVFEDLSLMSLQVQKYFLKFLEDPPSPVIILASEDNISSIILSRCMNIVKIEENFPKKKVSLEEFIENKKDNSKGICEEYYYYLNNPLIAKDYSEEFIDACIINFEYEE